MAAVGFLFLMNNPHMDIEVLLGTKAHLAIWAGEWFGLVNQFHVFSKGSLLAEALAAHCARELFWIIVNCPYMVVQAGLGFEALFTDRAEMAVFLNRLHLVLVVNLVHVSGQVRLLAKALAAKCAGEWFGLVVNMVHVPIQGSLLAEALAANRAIELFGIFVNCPYMEGQAGLGAEALFAHRAEMAVFLNRLHLLICGFFVHIFVPRNAGVVEVS